MCRPPTATAGNKSPCAAKCVFPPGANVTNPRARRNQSCLLQGRRLREFFSRRDRRRNKNGIIRKPALHRRCQMKVTRAPELLHRAMSWPGDSDITELEFCCIFTGDKSAPLDP